MCALAGREAGAAGGGKPPAGHVAGFFFFKARAVVIICHLVDGWAGGVAGEQLGDWAVPMYLYLCTYTYAPIPMYLCP